MICLRSGTTLSGICLAEPDCFALLRRARNDLGLVERFHIQLLQSCTTGGGRVPPVSPEVIHIKPLSWLPLTARSSCGAFPPPVRNRRHKPVRLLALKP